MSSSPRIAFAWKGLPAYGARLIRSAQQAADEPIAVIGTRAAVPVADVESILGAPVIWIDDHRPTSWRELGLEPPQLFFETSWATPAFNSLAHEAKRAGGKIVCTLDNHWRGNLKQVLGAAYFRFRRRRFYDAVWGPGASNRQFCRALGIPENRIYSHLYSGWTDVFTPGPPPDERPPRFVFVGQYIYRKGTDLLSKTFSRFAADHPEWQLQMFGSGNFPPRFENVPQASVEPFKQSHEIAAAMRAARFFLLPARDDHWPLVVHEAASSGCPLLLTNTVGNALDLATPQNAIVFDACDADALYAALCQAAAKDATWLRQAGAESCRLAAQFGPAQFADVFQTICADLL